MGKKKKRKLRNRNPLHRHPLLGKGAAHGKTRKAERRGDKAALRREFLHYFAAGP